MNSSSDKGAKEKRVRKGPMYETPDRKRSASPFTETARKGDGKPGDK